MYRCLESFLGIPITSISWYCWCPRARTLLSQIGLDGNIIGTLEVFQASLLGPSSLALRISSSWVSRYPRSGWWTTLFFRCSSYRTWFPRFPLQLFSHGSFKFMCDSTIHRPINSTKFIFYNTSHLIVLEDLICYSSSTCCSRNQLFG